MSAKSILMHKPTAGLAFRIIEYILSDPNIQRSVSARDRHPQTYFSQFDIQWIWNDEGSAAKGCIVKLIFEVNSAELEISDDIYVEVALRETTPPFHITKLGFF